MLFWFFSLFPFSTFKMIIIINWYWYIDEYATFSPFNLSLTRSSVCKMIYFVIRSSRHFFVQELSFLPALRPNLLLNLCPQIWQVLSINCHIIFTSKREFTWLLPGYLVMSGYFSLLFNFHIWRNSQASDISHHHQLTFAIFIQQSPTISSYLSPVWWQIVTSR